MSALHSRPDIEFESNVDEDVKEPTQFRVLLHNDDYTTMEFVVLVLMDVFNKNEAEAVRIMLAVHKEGIGVCGVYPEEMAETKVAQVHSMARRAGYPLRSSMEEV